MAKCVELQEIRCKTFLSAARKEAYKMFCLRGVKAPQTNLTGFHGRTYLGPRLKKFGIEI
jgi:hypothetical protein